MSDRDPHNVEDAVAKRAEEQAGPARNWPWHFKPPGFTLKPQDRLAVATIRFWCHQAELNGVDPKKIAGSLEHAEAIELWQKANPELTKLPD